MTALFEVAQRPCQRWRSAIHEELVGPGLQIGYEHTFIHQVADFLKCLETGEEPRPNFRDSLETQKVCDAVLDSAAKRQWMQVG